MEIQGKVIQILPNQGGMGKTGKAWKKQEVILETPGQYPKKVAVSIWNDKIDSFSLSEGDDVNLSIEAESREHNSKWFTELKAWKMNGVKQGAPRQSAPASESMTTSGPTKNFIEDDSQDLPF